MELTADQKTALAGWVREGISLSEIQKRLETQFGLRITYLDLRFLLDDLGLEIQSKPSAPPTPPPTPAATDPKKPGQVQVRIDKVTRPDALVSGSVTFSDGVTAQWHLDQLGRLALSPSQPGYKPTRHDLREFQHALSKAVEQAGLF